MHTLKGDLPDLFQLSSGERVRSVEDWGRRRAELRELIETVEYGHLPPAAAVSSELLHHHQCTLPGSVSVDHLQHRLVIEGGERLFWFILDLLIPRVDGEPAEREKRPVVVSGDGCWKYVTSEVVGEVLRRGYILATFNRTEIVPDNYRSERDSALYRV